MSDEKANGTTATQERKTTAVREFEWETPHGVVKFAGLETVRRYFCPLATDLEAVHFLSVCRYHKINPWLKEAYLIKYDETLPAQIVVGKDFYNRRAQSFPTYKGHAAGIILQVKDAAGKLSIERRAGAFHTAEETLLGGWGKVWRGDLEHPVEIEVQLKEYDKHMANWKTMPATMIRKVAISQAWREAYPTEFAGLLDEAEIPAAPMTIEMPKTNAEAKADESSARQAGGDGAPAHPGVEGAAATPAGDVPPPIAPKREAPSTKTPRVLAGELLRAQAQKSGESLTKILKRMTGKNDVSDLTDAEAQGVIAQLG